MFCIKSSIQQEWWQGKLLEGPKNMGIQGAEPLGGDFGKVPLTHSVSNSPN